MLEFACQTWYVQLLQLLWYLSILSIGILARPLEGLLVWTFPVGLEPHSHREISISSYLFLTDFTTSTSPRCVPSPANGVLIRKSSPADSLETGSKGLNPRGMVVQRRSWSVVFFPPFAALLVKKGIDTHTPQPKRPTRSVTGVGWDPCWTGRAKQDTGAYSKGRCNCMLCFKCTSGLRKQRSLTGPKSFNNPRSDTYCDTSFHSLLASSPLSLLSFQSSPCSLTFFTAPWVTSKTY